MQGIHTHIFLRQTMSLGNTVLQLIWCYYHGAHIASSCVDSIVLLLLLLLLLLTSVSLPTLPCSRTGIRRVKILYIAGLYSLGTFILQLLSH